MYVSALIISNNRTQTDRLAQTPQTDTACRARTTCCARTHFHACTHSHACTPFPTRTDCGARADCQHLTSVYGFWRVLASGALFGPIAPLIYSRSANCYDNCSAKDNAPLKSRRKMQATLPHNGLGWSALRIQLVIFLLQIVLTLISAVITREVGRERGTGEAAVDAATYY